MTARGQAPGPRRGTSPGRLRQSRASQQQVRGFQAARWPRASLSGGRKTPPELRSWRFMPAALVKWKGAGGTHAP